MRPRAKLTATEREPWCDVAAQLRAMLNSQHPKRAVWVSKHTPLEETFITKVHPWVHELTLPTGTLYASAHQCGRLADDPSEEMLAEILDYVAPKRAFWDSQSWSIWVVQARDADDRVVLEMVADLERLSAATERCRLYGKPHVVSLADALMRRRRLIAEEEAGRPAARSDKAE